MSSFEATKKRLKNIHGRIPEFPEELMRLLRMTYHIQKRMKVLYGSDNETSTASTLGEACMEKPANLTRVCNDLEAQGLITRGNRPGDRRCVMISLTDAGRALAEKVLPEVWSTTTRAYDGYSAEEVKLLESLLKRQLDNLESLT
jgi:MarR family transcriptional repressor of emrRAB